MEDKLVIESVKTERMEIHNLWNIWVNGIKIGRAFFVKEKLYIVNDENKLLDSDKIEKEIKARLQELNNHV